MNGATIRVTEDFRIQGHEFKRDAQYVVPGSIALLAVSNGVAKLVDRKIKFSGADKLYGVRENA